MPVSGAPDWVRKALALLHRKVERRMENDRQAWINLECTRQFDQFNPTALQACAFAEGLHGKIADVIPDAQSDARKRLRGLLASIEKVDAGSANCRAEMRSTVRGLLGVAYDWGYDRAELFTH